jgi:hypothetical protein
MRVILWVVAAAIALLIAIIAVFAARRDHATDNPDLGSISGAWLSEHNASHGDGKS